MSNTYRDTTNFACASGEEGKLRKKGKLEKRVEGAMFDKTADPTSAKRKKDASKKKRQRHDVELRKELSQI